jgi:hypothetical protein
LILGRGASCCIMPGVGKCPRIDAARLASRVPGLGGCITPRAKRASDKASSSSACQCISLTGWNDLFCCVDPESGSTFWMIFHHSARYCRNLA